MSPAAQKEQPPALKIVLRYAAFVGFVVLVALLLEFMPSSKHDARPPQGLRISAPGVEFVTAVPGHLLLES